MTEPETVDFRADELEVGFVVRRPAGKTDEVTRMDARDGHVYVLYADRGWCFYNPAETVTVIVDPENGQTDRR